MRDALAIARIDLETGRLWQARDRLTGLVGHRQDPEVLDLLATVYHRMGDLPAAGALWFVTGRDDQLAWEAAEAWRQRYGDDQARWRSLPGSIRRGHLDEDLAALQKSARMEQQGRYRVQRGRPYKEAWWEPLVFGGGAIVFVTWVLAMIVIGMGTVIGWIWG